VIEIKLPQTWAPASDSCGGSCTDTDFLTGHRDSDGIRANVDEEPVHIVARHAPATGRRYPKPPLLRSE